MKVTDIRTMAIDSAEKYFNFLSNNNDKGVQQVDVLELKYLEGKDLVIKLTLATKLFSSESIFFKNYKNGITYDIATIKVIEHDLIKNTLLIKPSEIVKSEFYNLKKADLKIIFDLKFLIKRVQTWYELNGSKISLPKCVSKIQNKFKEIQYFEEVGFIPSQNQIESISNIFNSPFSYIWGAPGTGKTQFVLAYAVLEYIRQGCKIIILAPTNNSLEQVLRGVIKITDKANIDRKTIIRIGTPSSKFAEEFPEVCEEKGIQKNLEEIDSKIDKVKKIITHYKNLDLIKNAEFSLTLFENFSTIILKKDNNKKKLFEIESECIRMKKEEAFLKDDLKKIFEKKRNIVQNSNSFGNKIFKFFSSKPTKVELNITGLESKITNSIKHIEFLKNEISIIETQIKQTKEVISEQERNLFLLITTIKEKFKNSPKFEPIIKILNVANRETVRTKLSIILKAEKEVLNRNFHLISDYSFKPIIDYENELNELNEKRIKIEGSSTEERLKTISVISCTLDSYIGKYTEEKLNTDHIFLDEAGYANIIKAMTLFNNKNPITFLGDHMQLPPVCEVQDKKIEEDANFQNLFLWAQSAIHLDQIFTLKKEVCLHNYLSNAPIRPKKIHRTSLNSTYRFGNNLAEILGKHVYNEAFKSSNSNGQTNIFYIDAGANDGFNSRTSINEVNSILALKNKLIRSNKTDFAILTPYKNQIKLLNNYLPMERNDLKILTVHGSQGREWDTVILSVVDTNDKWFTDSAQLKSKGLKLINTAVSRAKKQLIIVCDINYWSDQKGQLLTDLINKGTEIKIFK